MWRTVKEGYHLQFASRPPRFAGLIQSIAQGESALVLKDETTSFLNRRVICVVLKHERKRGELVQLVFLSSKKGGQNPPYFGSKGTFHIS